VDGENANDGGSLRNELQMGCILKAKHFDPIFVLLIFEFLINMLEKKRKNAQSWKLVVLLNFSF
jgi:hypothetical protein